MSNHYLFPLMIVGALVGCTTSFLRTTGIVTSLTSPSPTVSGDALVISSVTISSNSTSTTTTTTTSPAASPSANSTPETVTIYFDTTQSTVPISNECNVTASSSGTATSLPCFCQFSWNENNQSGSTSIAIPRKVQTALTGAQTGLVTCAAPSVYDSEIPTNTQINISLVASPSNPSIFTSTVYSFTKNATTTTGSFSDAQGHVFDNVLRYSCYQAYMRGMSVSNQSGTATQPGSSTSLSLPFYYGSKFCVTTAQTAGGATGGSCVLSSAQYSSQANYFNLYVRSSERGEINQYGSGYICPLVKEALGSTGTVGTTNQNWPLDSSFALSLGPTSDFSVGVQANTKLKGSTSAADADTLCYPTTSGSTVPTGSLTSNFVKGCLGFAAQANADGTCSSFTDSSGQARQTYRLRRFVAIYPPVYDSNGDIYTGLAQGIDTIYVLDRPVSSTSNTNPLKPFTMRGPKPCPFAYFDRQGVTSTATPAISGYVSTTNAAWNGTNVDAIQFPNRDLAAGYLTGPSCSATLPIVNDSGTAFGLVTVNQYASSNIQNSSFLRTLPSGTVLKHLYIRPQPPFTPHYEEDTDFVACAPQAVPVIDPPLHFSRDPASGNVAWCAESYPSQNPNVQNIDPVPAIVPAPSATPSPTPTPSVALGYVAPYTSHVVSNSASSSCLSTPLTIPTNTNYSYSTGTPQYARHPSGTYWPPNQTATRANTTCDRTVSSTNLSWTQFPLIAPAPDVEAAIMSDSSYMCMITYDNSGTKANLTTPSSGCCDSYSVRVPSGVGSALGAHLEPDVTCRPPTY